MVCQDTRKISAPWFVGQQQTGVPICRTIRPHSKCIVGIGAKTVWRDHQLWVRVGTKFSCGVNDPFSIAVVTMSFLIVATSTASLFATSFYCSNRISEIIPILLHTTIRITKTNILDTIIHYISKARGAVINRPFIFHFEKRALTVLLQFCECCIIDWCMSCPFINKTLRT